MATQGKVSSAAQIHNDALRSSGTTAWRYFPSMSYQQAVGEYHRCQYFAAHVPVSSHIFTEQSICVAASDSNCVSVEHMPWFEKLFNEDIEIENGSIRVPDRPGIGFTFDRDAIRGFEI